MTKKEVRGQSVGAGEPSCGDVNIAGCELPGMAYPRCKAKCCRSVGHPGKCWCSFHERYPWDLKPLPKNGNRLVKKEQVESSVTSEDEITKTPGKEDVGAAKEQLTDADLETTREDHPLIDPKTRGSKRLAMQELGTKEDREKWRRILLNDMYARSSRAPRETLWQTWCEAAKWFGLPELPLTYDLVIACATFFKAGKYRSATLYFSRARQEHVEWTKTEVPPNVLLAMSKAVRSIERGMGATVLKDCFQMQDLIKLGEF